MKSDQSTSFSVRVQNLSGMADPNLPNPRRPFIVKRILKEGWGGYDGSIKIRDRAHKLHSADIDLVSNIFNGLERHQLPLIYASLDSDAKYRLDCDKLAWELGGVAHVFCEPSRVFSYQLAKKVGFRNPYLGGVGILLPDGRIERYRPESINEDTVGEIQIAAIRATSNAVSSEICSWSSIRDTEASLALERLKEEKSSNVSAYIEAFDDQITSLREQISNLENENTTLKLRAAIARSDKTSVVSLLDNSEEELYENEVAHLLEKGLTLILANSEPSMRRHEKAKSLLSKLSERIGSFDLERQVKDCFSKYEGLNPTKRAEIEALGFSISDDGKHYKLVFMDNPKYMFSLSKTPSDHRSGKNMASTICSKIF